LLLRLGRLPRLLRPLQLWRPRRLLRPLRLVPTLGSSAHRKGHAQYVKQRPRNCEISSRACAHELQNLYSVQRAV
jgi:hypothetical protein